MPHTTTHPDTTFPIRTRTILLAGLCGLLAACTTASPPDQHQPPAPAPHQTAPQTSASANMTTPPIPPLSPSVLHKQWILHSINQKPAQAMQLERAQITLQADGSVYGTTGCNRFFGQYQLSAPQPDTHAAADTPHGLRFAHGMGMTRMACHDVNEHPLMQALESTRQVRVTNGQLWLLRQDGQPLTIWTPAPATPTR